MEVVFSFVADDFYSCIYETLKPLEATERKSGCKLAGRAPHHLRFAGIQLETTAERGVHAA